MTNLIQQSVEYTPTINRQKLVNLNGFVVSRPLPRGTARFIHSKQFTDTHIEWADWRSYFYIEAQAETLVWYKIDKTTVPKKKYSVLRTWPQVLNFFKDHV